MIIPMKKLVVGIFSMLTFTLFSQEQFSLLETSLITVDGTSTIHDWKVTAHEHSGEATFKVENGDLSKILLIVEVEYIRGERGATMDNKLKKALKSNEFPQISFNLLESVSVKNGIGQENNLINVNGTLTIAGAGKDVSSMVEAHFNEGVLYLKGMVPLLLSDYKIEPPTAMFGQIETGNQVTVNFDLKFSK